MVSDIAKVIVFVIFLLDSSEGVREFTKDDFNTDKRFIAMCNRTSPVSRRKFILS